MNNVIKDDGCDRGVPILLIIFNRLETAKVVFEQIKSHRPRFLFIAADGSRQDRPEEREKCAEVRNYVLSGIDWPCEVHTLFRDQNLGCRAAVSSAISWFFENVPRGIILEDDCVPDASFFCYCERMLDKYADDERVMMISGTNYLMGEEIPGKDYFFSRYYSIWGWATWRRAWKKYDINMSLWPKLRSGENLRYLTGYDEIAGFYRQMLDVAFENKIDTWDLQWVYSCLLNNGLAVVPVNNLVSNIGSIGTHTNGEECKFNNMPTKPYPSHGTQDEAFCIPEVEIDLKCFTNIGVSIVTTCEKEEKSRKSAIRRVFRRILKFQ